MEFPVTKVHFVITRKHDLNIIIVDGPRFVSDCFIMSSVLLIIPLFVSLNTQRHNTAEMVVHISKQ